ncbi:hypothetical protein [Streptomyces gilvosporeus]|uniref:Secreted protein n=1 Tax=Streptomyces gilvosporeus TaxID=553510 RepID=A0A1V0TYG9_9ACTN|nr:hypothetical protein [Streptomyces gilvosporeus]ARF57951.1 hypothetical protein B1H19_30510 [Streptomyces gilvosporeus]
MRRITTAFGALATAGMLALALPTSAHAANGTLIVNGVEHDSPSGCYPSGQWPLRVTNRTDGPAYVMSGADCAGSVVAVAQPGQSAVSEFGSSVYIR